MTHLMARGDPPGRRGPQATMLTASGKGRNAPDGRTREPGQMSHYQRSLV